VLDVTGGVAAPGVPVQVYPQWPTSALNQSWSEFGTLDISFKPCVTFTGFAKSDGNVVYATGLRVFTLYKIVRLGLAYSAQSITFVVGNLRALSSGFPPYDLWGNTELASLYIPGGFGGFLAPPDLEFEVPPGDGSIDLSDSGVRVILMTDAPDKRGFVPLDYPGAAYLLSVSSSCTMVGTLDSNTILNYQ
jgi:hypothetical protein